MLSPHDIHVVYGSGPVGTAVVETLLERGQRVRVVTRSSTRKGLAQELMEAHRSGKVRAVSVRAADLFGPHVAESLVGARLFGPALAGKPVQLLANPDLPHSVSYIRDVGRAMVTLGED